ncbi:hypothetical protein LC605_20310 [Nostoc sp. CHAB 5836]|uniref:hypothetical protein n=1 Tax=Nostoc sp. CHAB 5836 TaxID=2780404 RepID=UPI001E555293|nr:hypothetical protein [Nostoc sp. CHAB 5836]MCC5617388.1 hypothetical protein [Nostoc sp. CHAB 5836]
MAKVIGHKKFVFVADCKASAIATRAQIAANGGVYCFPVSMSGQHPQYLRRVQQILRRLLEFKK